AVAPRKTRKTRKKREDRAEDPPCPPFCCFVSFVVVRPWQRSCIVRRRGDNVREDVGRYPRGRGPRMSFANQVAVITGASSGIGWALAKERSRQGARVGLVARRRENLEKLAAEIRGAGGAVALEAADVADRGQAVAAVRALAAQLGPIDLLVANAGL